MKEQNLAGKSFVVSGLKVIGADSRSRAEAVKAAVRSASGTQAMQLQYDGLEKRVREAASDNLLTVKEKKELQRQWLAIEGMYSSLVEQARTWGIDSAGDNDNGSYEAYLGAYGALKAALDPLFLDMKEESAVDGGALQSLFEDYYDKDTILNNIVYNRSHDDIEARLDAGEITVTSTSPNWIVSPRMVVKHDQAITLTVSVPSLSGFVARWDCSDPSVTVSPSADTHNCELSVKAGTMLADMDVECAVGTFPKKVVRITCNPTGADKPLYFGTMDTAPTGAVAGTGLDEELMGEPYRAGDYYLDPGTGEPYIYDGSAWVDAANYPDWKAAAIACGGVLPTILNQGMDIQKTAAAMYAYVGNLAAATASIEHLLAAEAFIEELFARKVTLRGQGVISSEGYADDGTAGWRISSDGKAVFNNVEIRGFGESLGIQIRNGKSPSSPAILVTQQAGKATPISAAVPNTHYDMGELASSLQPDSEQAARVLYNGKEYARYVLAKTGNSTFDGQAALKTDKFDYKSPASEGAGTFTYTYVTPCHATVLDVRLVTRHSWKTGSTSWTKDLQSHSVAVTLPDGTETTHTQSFVLEDVPAGTTVKDTMAVTRYNGYHWTEYGNAKDAFQICGSLVFPTGHLYFGDESWEDRAQVEASGYLAQGDHALVVGDTDSSAYVKYGSVTAFLELLEGYRQTWKCDGAVTDTYSDGTTDLTGILSVSVDSGSYTVGSATRIVRRTAITPFIKGPISLSVQAVGSENAIVVSNIEFDDAHGDIGTHDRPAQSIWTNSINGVPFTSLARQRYDELYAENFHSPKASTASFQASGYDAVQCFYITNSNTANPTTFASEAVPLQPLLSGKLKNLQVKLDTLSMTIGVGDDSQLEVTFTATRTSGSTNEDTISIHGITWSLA